MRRARVPFPAPMIEVEHLTRRFGSHAAVDDVSFRLERGEVVGFLGPNGAGKTTTMRILTGFLPATSSARLEVACFDVLRQSLDVRRRIGYLPEAVPLYREMRVREMMVFQGRLHGMPRADLKREVPRVLERVGVLDRQAQLIGNLSRGLRQRVGLAVALLPDPEVLILDEPTSGLDPLQRREVRGLIRELADEHTVLFSSHILAEIENVCPRVIIVHEGRLVADGTQEDLMRRFAGSGHVRLEAVVGNVREAIGLLDSLDVVTRVDEQGRLGIHHAFDVFGEGDLREDVGALAAQRGWALRELSWRRPTLEELFARLVLGGEELAAGATAALPAGESVARAVGPQLELAPDPPASGPAGNKVIYSLNPFDRGAARDLGQPMDPSPQPG